MSKRKSFVVSVIIRLSVAGLATPIPPAFWETKQHCSSLQPITHVEAEKKSYPTVYLIPAFYLSSTHSPSPVTACHMSCILAQVVALHIGVRKPLESMPFARGRGTWCDLPPTLPNIHLHSRMLLEKA
jgi:hypothetical protein